MAKLDSRCVVVYTKPAIPGRVKTRLIGELSAHQTAELHEAFLGDLAERLGAGRFRLVVSWAAEEGESLPEHLAPEAAEHVHQPSGDLGDRLYGGLSEISKSYSAVAAVGSDHPELTCETIERAFEHLEGGADVVIGPTSDGGYYLIGLNRQAIHRGVFEGIPWSTESVFAETLERCRRLGLSVARLPEGHDVDVADDLRALADRLSTQPGVCPRTRGLLEDWGWSVENKA